MYYWRSLVLMGMTLCFKGKGSNLRKVNCWDGKMFCINQLLLWMLLFFLVRSIIHSRLRVWEFNGFIQSNRIQSVNKTGFSSTSVLGALIWHYCFWLDQLILECRMKFCHILFILGHEYLMVWIIGRFFASFCRFLSFILCLIVLGFSFFVSLYENSTMGT